MRDPLAYLMPAELDVSVIVPVHDEAPNIRPLIEEIYAVLRPGPSPGPHPGPNFEIVYVDDGSRDDTYQRLLAMQPEVPELRILRHARACGQSAAIRSGVLAARGRLIVTLDGDGQNDPADIPKLLRAMAPDVGAVPGLVAGHRVNRQDSWLKKLSSRVGNGVRGMLLGDRTPDTGCGLKVISRALFLRLPYFDHMHRFLPALVLREGYEVDHVPVNHRPRSAGRSKYGVLNRLFVSIADLFGVMWLKSRCRLPGYIDNPHGNGAHGNGARGNGAGGAPNRE